MKLSVVIPVFNEIFTIKEIVRRVRAVPVDKEIILVDDCSTDGTRRVLESLEGPDLKIVHHERNRGKGAGIRTAAEHVTGDVVVIQDADLEYNPAELPRLLEFIDRNEADVVYGSRFLGPHRSFMFTHFLGNKVLNLITNILYNVCLTDMETCYKVMRADIFKKLDLKANRFDIEPEITAKLILSGYRLIEVPITYVGRDYAEGKKIGWKDGVAAIWTLLYWRLFGPTREDDTLDRLESAHRYNSWVASWIRSDVGQRILEIGAGVGSVSKFFVDREELHLLDINPRYIERLKKKFQYLDHVSYYQMDFNDEAGMSVLKDRGVDTVIMSNVLEHFDDDDAVLEKIRAVLPVGGSLVLIIPAHQDLFGTLDLSVGHVRRYDHAGLTRKLESHGFEACRHSYHNWLGAVGWYIQGRLIKKKEITKGSVRSFEAVMPLARALDGWFPLEFGQSLVMIARKTG